jgi:hypothetical protein
VVQSGEEIYNRRFASVETGFWQHQVLVWRRVFEKFHWGRDLLIATAIAAITAFLQVTGGLVEVTQTKRFWMSVIAPYAVVLAVHILYRIVTAPWKLHQEQERRCEATKAVLSVEVADAKRELENTKLTYTAPELFLKLDHSTEAKKYPGFGITHRVVVIENNSDRDAYNVQIEPLCFDPTGRISAEFKPVSRIGAHQSVEVEGTVLGLQGSENKPHDFETIYYFGADEAKYWRNLGKMGEAIEYDIRVIYTDYQKTAEYRATAHLLVGSHLEKTEIKWLGVEVTDPKPQ